MIDKRQIMQTDMLLLGAMICLSVIGVVAIYSATFAQGPYYSTRQLYWLLFGLIVIIPIIIIDYMVYERLAYVIYALCIITLVAVLIIGHKVGGAQRWINLGFASFQPSEFAKIAFTLALARYLSLRPPVHGGMGLRQLVVPGLIMVVPFLLIAKEPDLGTGLIFVFIFCSMMIINKIRLKTIIIIFFGLAAMFPLAWMQLKGYQQARLLSFIDPSRDPLGSGYHLHQSKIAIGSGGLFGTGFTESKQASLRFLPEHHTDFIFPVLAEEWGLIGSFVVLALFLIFIMRGINTALNAKDRFGFLLAFGLTSMIFWHMSINIAMVTGLLPVVGVPLPFLSYGGSFLLTTLISSALIINISMRKYILG